MDGEEVTFDLYVNELMPGYWNELEVWNTSLTSFGHDVAGFAEDCGWRSIKAHDSTQAELTIEVLAHGGDPALMVHRDWRPGRGSRARTGIFFPYGDSATDYRARIHRILSVAQGSLHGPMELRLDLSGQVSSSRAIPPGIVELATTAGHLLFREVLYPVSSASLAGAFRQFVRLVRDEATLEGQLQALLEEWPELLPGESIVRVMPHIVIPVEDSRLIPDFAIQPATSHFYDILDLKRPSETLIVGSATRPRLSHRVREGVAQLLDYDRALRQDTVTERVRELFDVDFLNPRLQLVIGRVRDKETDRRLRLASEDLGQRTSVISYDALVESARRRYAFPDN